MEPQIDQVFWTAMEWARRTRVPYRSILAAASKGELAAIRPSGTNHGCILISEASWKRWLMEVEMKKRIPPRVPPRPTRSHVQLSDLALV